MARHSTASLTNSGWRPIASDAHAAQLLRRELKYYSKWQQRDTQNTFAWDVRRLLAIKRGNWYKFLRNSRNRYCSIVIWPMPGGG